MSKVKIIKYAIVLLFIISLGYNYHHYNKKNGYMEQLGAENQRTVRVALNVISDENTDYWINTLKEQKGDVYLERHLGELRQLSSEFHGMSGEMSSIGMLIDDIINQYYELENGIKSGKNIEVYKIAIEENSQFIRMILNQINIEFGENKELWYEELSGFQTETQKEIWEKVKEFDTQNKEVIYLK